MWFIVNNETDQEDELLRSMKQIERARYNTAYGKKDPVSDDKYDNPKWFIEINSIGQLKDLQQSYFFYGVELYDDTLIIKRRYERYP